MKKSRKIVITILAVFMYIGIIVPLKHMSVGAATTADIITNIDMIHTNGTSTVVDNSWSSWEQIIIKYDFDLGYPSKLDSTYEVNYTLPDGIKFPFSGLKSIDIPMLLPDGTKIKVGTLVLSNEGNINIKFEKNIVDNYNDVKGSFTIVAKFTDDYKGTALDFGTSGVIDIDYNNIPGSSVQGNKPTKNSYVTDLEKGILNWQIKVKTMKDNESTLFMNLDNAYIIDTMQDGTHVFKPYEKGMDPTLDGTQGNNVFKNSPWEDIVKNGGVYATNWSDDFLDSGKNVVKITLHSKAPATDYTHGIIWFTEIEALETNEDGQIIAFKVDLDKIQEEIIEYSDQLSAVEKDKIMDILNTYLSSISVSYYTEIIDQTKDIYYNGATIVGDGYYDKVTGQNTFWASANASGSLGFVKFVKVENNQGIIEKIKFSNAQFKLEKIVNGQKIFQSIFTMNDDGTATLPLTYGDYIITEIKAPLGYELLADPIDFKFDPNSGGTMNNPFEFEIENKRAESTSLQIEKIWADNLDHTTQDEFITIEVYTTFTDGSNEKVYDTYRILSKNGWKLNLENLPLLDETGNDVVYHIREIDQLPGYVSTIVSEEEQVKIVNSPSISISGEKTWNDNGNAVGLRPATITVNLFKNNILFKTTTSSATDSWKYSFADLPKNDINGNENIYRVEEVTVDDYQVSYNGYDILNTLKTEISGTKTWNDQNNVAGVRPTTINLILEDTLGNVYSVNPTWTNNDVNSNVWSYRYDDLKKYYSDGSEIIYKVREVNVDPHYTVSYSSDSFDITNTHVPGTVTLQGTKTWVDGSNHDGLRPASITLILRADGIEVTGVTPTWIKNGDVWSYEYTNLPEKANGVNIHYTVEEVAVLGYIGTQSGNDFTNTQVPTTPEKPVLPNTGIADPSCMTGMVIVLGALFIVASKGLKRRLGN